MDPLAFRPRRVGRASSEPSRHDPPPVASLTPRGARPTGPGAGPPPWPTGTKSSSASNRTAPRSTTPSARREGDTCSGARRTNGACDARASSPRDLSTSSVTCRSRRDLPDGMDCRHRDHHAPGASVDTTVGRRVPGVAGASDLCAGPAGACGGEACRIGGEPQVEGRGARAGQSPIQVGSPRSAHRRVPAPTPVTRLRPHLSPVPGPYRRRRAPGTPGSSPAPSPRRGSGPPPPPAPRAPPSPPPAAQPRC